MFNLGDYGKVKYLMADNNTNGVQEFEIDRDSGVLRVKNPLLLDMTKTRSFKFHIEARDYYRSDTTYSILI